MDAIESYNIALIPPASIAAQARRISLRLKRFGSLFTLDEKKFFPHVTLFMITIERSQLPHIVRALQTIARTHRAPMLRSTRYRFIQPGYIDVAFERTGALIRLQKNIIASLNPFRISTKKQVRSDDGNALERNNILRYEFAKK